MPGPKLAFVDSTDAAGRLRVSRDTLYQWVADGRLKTYGGTPKNPFFRSADIETLAEELEVPVEKAIDPKEFIRQDPVRKVRTRLTVDAKWNDITSDDLAAWVREVDPIKHEAFRSLAQMVKAKMDEILAVLDAEAAARSGGPLSPRQTDHQAIDLASDVSTTPPGGE